MFGDVAVSGADEVKRNWDEIKREEKKQRAERGGYLSPRTDCSAWSLGPARRGLDPWMALRAAARRYRDLVRAWEWSLSCRTLVR